MTPLELAEELELRLRAAKRTLASRGVYDDAQWAEAADPVEARIFELRRDAKQPGPGTPHVLAEDYVYEDRVGGAAGVADELKASVTGAPKTLANSVANMALSVPQQLAVVREMAARGQAMPGPELTPEEIGGPPGSLHRSMIADLRKPGDPGRVPVDVTKTALYARPEAAKAAFKKKINLSPVEEASVGGQIGSVAGYGLGSVFLAVIPAVGVPLAMAVGGTAEAQGAFEDALAQGASFEDAAKHGFTSGAIAAGFELAPIHAFKGILKGTKKAAGAAAKGGYLRAFAKLGGLGGFEEFGTELGIIASGKNIGIEQGTSFGEALRRAGYAGALGVIGEGPIGVGAHAMHQWSKRRADAAEKLGPGDQPITAETAKSLLAGIEGLPQLVHTPDTVRMQPGPPASPELMQSAAARFAKMTDAELVTGAQNLTESLREQRAKGDVGADKTISEVLRLVMEEVAQRAGLQGPIKVPDSGVVSDEALKGQVIGLVRQDPARVAKALGELGEKAAKGDVVAEEELYRIGEIELSPGVTVAQWASVRQALPGLDGQALADAMRSDETSPAAIGGIEGFMQVPGLEPAPGQEFQPRGKPKHPKAGIEWTPEEKAAFGKTAQKQQASDKAAKAAVDRITKILAGKKQEGQKPPTPKEIAGDLRREDTTAPAAIGGIEGFMQVPGLEPAPGHRTFAETAERDAESAIERLVAPIAARPGPWREAPAGTTPVLDERAAGRPRKAPPAPPGPPPASPTSALERRAVTGEELTPAEWQALQKEMGSDGLEKLLGRRRVDQLARAAKGGGFFRPTTTTPTEKAPPPGPAPTVPPETPQPPAAAAPPAAPTAPPATPTTEPAGGPAPVAAGSWVTTQHGDGRVLEIHDENGVLVELEDGEAWYSPDEVTATKAPPENVVGFPERPTTVELGSDTPPPKPPGPVAVPPAPKPAAPKPKPAVEAWPPPAPDHPQEQVGVVNVRLSEGRDFGRDERRRIIGEVGGQHSGQPINAGPIADMEKKRLTGMIDDRRRLVAAGYGAEAIAKQDEHIQAQKQTLRSLREAASRHKPTPAKPAPPEPAGGPAPVAVDEAPTPKSAVEGALTARQLEVVGLMDGSGTVEDHIASLYREDATDALATDFDLDTVTDEDVEALRRHYVQRTRALLKERGAPDVLTVYRAGGKLDPSSEIAFVSTDRKVAERIVGRRGPGGPRSVGTFEVNLSDVVGAQDLARGTYAEAALLVPHAALRPAAPKPAAPKPKEKPKPKPKPYDWVTGPRPVVEFFVLELDENGEAVNQDAFATEDEAMAAASAVVGTQGVAAVVVEKSDAVRSEVGKLSDERTTVHTAGSKTSIAAWEGEAPAPTATVDEAPTPTLLPPKEAHAEIKKLLLRWKRTMDVGKRAGLEKQMGRILPLLEGQPQDAEARGGILRAGLNPDDLIAEARKEHDRLEKAGTKVEAKDVPPGRTDFEPELGAASRVHTPKGLTVDTRYALVEASEPITSHDAETMEERDDFDQPLQGRKREKFASTSNIDKHSKTLRPAEQGASVKASDGAPLVLKNAMVISGNRRTLATLLAHKNGLPTSQEYIDYLTEHADEFGIDVDEVESMEAPLLIRVIQTEMTREELIAFAKDANEDSVEKLSPSEQAASDADALTPAMVELLDTSLEGGLAAPSNRAFISEFVKKVVSDAGKSEAYTDSGKPTMQLYTRIRNALFARAFGTKGDAADVLAALSEDGSAAGKQLLRALTSAAPAHARLKSRIDAGVSYPIEFTDELIGAASLFIELKAARTTLSEKQAQIDQAQPIMGGLEGSRIDVGTVDPSVEAFVKLFEEGTKGNRSADVAEILRQLAVVVEALGNPQQPGGHLLGAEENIPSKEEVYAAAVERAAEIGQLDPGGQAVLGLEDSQPEGQPEDGGAPQGKGGRPRPEETGRRDSPARQGRDADTKGPGKPGEKVPSGEPNGQDQLFRVGPKAASILTVDDVAWAVAEITRLTNRAAGIRFRSEVFGDPSDPSAAESLRAQGVTGDGPVSVTGVTVRGVITLALTQEVDSLRDTVRHETWHALEYFGLIPKGSAALVRAIYPGGEESAEAFARFVANSESEVPTAVKSIFSSAARFRLALNAGFAGRGIYTVEDVFGRVAAESIGPPGGATPGAFAERVTPTPQQPRSAAPNEPAEPTSVESLLDDFESLLDDFGDPGDKQQFSPARLSDPAREALRKLQEAVAADRADGGFGFEITASSLGVAPSALAALERAGLASSRISKTQERGRGRQQTTVRRKWFHLTEAGREASEPKQQFSPARRMRMGVERAVAAADSAKSWKDWYDRHAELIDSIFGDDAKLFASLLAATSQRNTVKGNVTAALKAYRQLKEGRPFTGYMRDVVKNLNRVRRGEPTTGLKIGEFERAMHGDETATPADRWIARVFYGKASLTPAQTRRIHAIIKEAASRLGWAPRQVQAALWAFQQLKEGTAPENIDDYGKLLTEKAESIRALVAGFSNARGPGGGVRPSGAARPRAGARAQAGQAKQQFSPARRVGQNPQTDTPEFREFFRDSKVVDENGDPLVVYHGTWEGGVRYDRLGREVANPPFMVFDTSGGAATNTPISALGAFFTPDRGYAESYATNAGFREVDGSPRVISSYLSVTNPLVVDFSVAAELMGYGRDAKYKTKAEASRAAKELKASALREGRDGIFFMRDGSLHELVVFEPTQVKSAIGNRGTFDRNDPRIQFSTSRVTPTAPQQPIANPKKAQSKALREALYLLQRYTDYEEGLGPAGLKAGAFGRLVTRMAARSVGVAVDELSKALDAVALTPQQKKGVKKIMGMAVEGLDLDLWIKRYRDAAAKATDDAEKAEMLRAFAMFQKAKAVLGGNPADLFETPTLAPGDMFTIKLGGSGTRPARYVGPTTMKDGSPGHEYEYESKSKPGTWNKTRRGDVSFGKATDQLLAPRLKKTPPPGRLGKLVPLIETWRRLDDGIYGRFRRVAGAAASGIVPNHWPHWISPSVRWAFYGQIGPKGNEKTGGMNTYQVSVDRLARKLKAKSPKLTPEKARENAVKLIGRGSAAMTSHHAFGRRMGSFEDGRHGILEPHLLDWSTDLTHHYFSSAGTRIAEFGTWAKPTGRKNVRGQQIMTNPSKEMEDFVMQEVRSNPRLGAVEADRMTTYFHEILKSAGYAVSASEHAERGSVRFVVDVVFLSKLTSPVLWSANFTQPFSVGAILHGPVNVLKGFIDIFDAKKRSIGRRAGAVSSLGSIESDFTDVDPTQSWVTNGTNKLSRIFLRPFKGTEWSNNSTSQGSGHYQGHALLEAAIANKRDGGSIGRALLSLGEKKVGAPERLLRKLFHLTDQQIAGAMKRGDFTESEESQVRQEGASSVNFRPGPHFQPGRFSGSSSLSVLIRMFRTFAYNVLVAQSHAVTEVRHGNIKPLISGLTMMVASGEFIGLVKSLFHDRERESNYADSWIGKWGGRVLEDGTMCGSMGFFDRPGEIIKVLAAPTDSLLGAPNRAVQDMGRLGYQLRQRWDSPKAWMSAMNGFLLAQLTAYRDSRGIVRKIAIAAGSDRAKMRRDVDVLRQVGRIWVQKNRGSGIRPSLMPNPYNAEVNRIVVGILDLDPDKMATAVQEGVSTVMEREDTDDMKAAANRLFSAVDGRNPLHQVGAANIDDFFAWVGEHRGAKFEARMRAAYDYYKDQTDTVFRPYRR